MIAVEAGLEAKAVKELVKAVEKAAVSSIGTGAVAKKSSNYIKTSGIIEDEISLTEASIQETIDTIDNAIKGQWANKAQKKIEENKKKIKKTLPKLA
ncbi:hypothetical protein [Companilactobacillus mishanensis]|uniref:Uncharacterized protein n=1 Tax=Companilactobacillus mishanensis TaxID=2486008 RepID=A0A5P0ZJY6_9LACO|nr:hypothetical protein [Companilactobacillus mishanensis]MQS53362.1 hypothetical protein [Companilactobacillus mishanensis]